MDSGKKLDVKPGGLRQEISTNSNQTTYFGGVTINTEKAPGAAELEDWMALQA